MRARFQAEQVGRGSDCRRRLAEARRGILGAGGAGRSCKPEQEEKKTKDGSGDLFRTAGTGGATLRQMRREDYFLEE